MEKISVNLKTRSYQIHLAHGFADNFPAELDLLFGTGRRYGLVTNTTIQNLYSKQVERWREKLDIVNYALPDGERYKTLEHWAGIFDAMLENRLDRTAVIIAFGGGVVGDMAGFAAASLLRGVDYVQIPTTLLAMVDSSVGGKTGVDHVMGKNLIGAFHQPRMVLMDTAFLDTLPEREFAAGWGEVFKYGFIGGRSMFDFVTRNQAAFLNRDKEIVAEGIRRSITIKADVVSKDEMDTGLRACLNFGHTFGHSLEHSFNFEGLLHGEAVLWGVACAIELGRRVGSIPPRALDEYKTVVRAMILPSLPSQPQPERLYESMFSDKKAAGGKLSFVLPAKPGSSIITSDVSKEQVMETLISVLGN